MFRFVFCSLSWSILLSGWLFCYFDPTCNQNKVLGWYFKPDGTKWKLEWLQAEVKPFKVELATLGKPHQPGVQVDILHYVQQFQDILYHVQHFQSCIPRDTLNPTTRQMYMQTGYYKVIFASSLNLITPFLHDQQWVGKFEHDLWRRGCRFSISFDFKGHQCFWQCLCSQCILVMFFKR